MIRQAHKTDTEAITRIARLTGAAGRDATPQLVHGNLIADVFALPSLALAPSIPLVAETDGQVADYAVGTPDSQGFDREMARDWWPGLQARHPRPGGAEGSLHHWYHTRIHQAEPLPHAITNRYPAHLHLNVDPAFQGRGFGRKLVRTWLKNSPVRVANPSMSGSIPPTRAASPSGNRAAFTRLTTNLALPRARGSVKTCSQNQTDIMMTDKTVSPKLKAALEYGPLLLFFVGYFLLRGETFHILGADRAGVVLMTVVFVPVLVVSTLLLWRLTGEISAMQIITLVMVVVLGGLTIWLNDEQFFKMKPTLVYVVFGALLGAGLLRGKSWLQLVIGKHLPMKHQGWMILTKRVMLAFFAMALANELVWRTMSTEFWVTFKTFGLSALLIVFFMSQAKLISTYAEDEPK